MRLLKMPETADGRLIGHRLATKINANKTPHRERIVQRLFGGRVRQVEPLLQAVNPQNSLDAVRDWPSSTRASADKRRTTSPSRSFDIRRRKSAAV
jgi:hypothetical protein